jgi:uncharacterized protein
VTPKETSKRYLACAIGILASSAAIAHLTKSGLGTSQISSLPYVMSRIFPLSFGGTSFFMNAAFVLVQLILLRRANRRDGRLDDDALRVSRRGLLVQIPLTFLFSITIDLMMWLFADLSPATYPARIALCAFGCVELGLGISLQIASGVAILPADALVHLVSRRTGRDFGALKTAFDLTLVASATVLSLACLHRVEGIREGTLISALAVGTISRFFLSRIRPLA